MYRCRAPGGTSAAGPATGPSGTGSGITDGSCVWDYLGPFTGAVIDVSPVLGLPNPTPLFAQITLLEQAEIRVSDPVYWGTSFDTARRYMAAHFGELARLNGHGPLTSQGVGPLARGFAALQGQFALDYTPAGKMYLDLVRTTKGVLGIVV